jgi:hypothetical protein
MIQTHGTYEIADGALMPEQDRIITIHNCRVTVEPIQEPSPQLKKPRLKGKAEKAADTFCQCAVVVFALYLVFEVMHAFATGAVQQVLR